MEIVYELLVKKGQIMCARQQRMRREIEEKESACSSQPTLINMDIYGESRNKIVGAPMAAEAALVGAARW
jgi:predicted glycosyltransferase